MSLGFSPYIDTYRKAVSLVLAAALMLAGFVAADPALAQTAPESGWLSWSATPPTRQARSPHPPMTPA